MRRSLEKSLEAAQERKQWSMFNTGHKARILEEVGNELAIRLNQRTLFLENLDEV